MNLRIFLLASGILASLCVHGQTKLGTNPITLNGDALLELESNNKGLLMTRVALSGTASASPLSAHVAGMTVYNTATTGDVAPGFYYNNGTRWARIANSVSSYASTAAATAATPTAAVNGNIIYDQSCGCAKLYMNNAFVPLYDNAQAQTFVDTSAANSSTPSTRMMGNIIFDQSSNGLKIFNGNKWITPSASPINYIFADTIAANSFAPNLKMNGQQIFDNSCTCLKVYSNGWKSASATSTASGNGVGFSAGIQSSGSLISLSSISLSLSGSSKQVNFNSVDYNDGGAYSTTTTDSKFAAPSAGLYHFDVSILTAVTANLLGNYNVYLVVGNTIKFTQPLGSISAGNIVSITTQGQASFSKDLKLSAGDEVRVVLGYTGASLGVTLVDGGTSFDGHLVK